MVFTALLAAHSGALSRFHGDEIVVRRGPPTFTPLPLRQDSLAHCGAVFATELLTEPDAEPDWNALAGQLNTWAQNHPAEFADRTILTGPEVERHMGSRRRPFVAFVLLEFHRLTAVVRKSSATSACAIRRKSPRR